MHLQENTLFDLNLAVKVTQNVALNNPHHVYHRDFLHKFLFNDFNTSLILSLIKNSTLKIVQLLRVSQGNTQSIFYLIISNLLFLFPQ